MKTINDIIDMCFDGMDCNTCMNYCVCADYLRRFSPLPECAMTILAIGYISKGAF